MKPLIQFGLCCLLAQGVFAAHSGGVAAGGGHSGGVAAGRHGGHGFGSARAFGRGRYGGYGLYGGYGYGLGGYFADYDDDAPLNDSGYAPPPVPPGGSNVTIVYPPVGPMMPPQTAHPVIHEYSQPADYGAPPAGEGEPVLYLIAFRDNTIRAAMTYWVQDDKLCYLDRDHVEKQAPLSAVDRQLSARLNRERHVPFNIQ